MESLFFDLDGTLTDPKPGIVGCIRHALGCLALPVPEAEDLTWCIGPPLHDSLASLCGSPELGARALAHFRERFGTVGLYENAVYPGIAELLAELGAQGRRLFLATSKPRPYAERILAHFELDGFFERAFGSELDGRLANKAALLAHALAETGAASAGAVMIGDRSHDVAGAKANGLASIGVLYGYGSEAELRAAGADALAATVPALAGLLAPSEKSGWI
ncbi:phosphoglycolate phosphatase [Tistlia consotensis]|uniref:Phosphoglycolate phosphatase n=1 Tax=Tistlia consotensis USBA 355 TaxID=560819 RepID=A0A1Y6BNX2_9PROT|nr:HAD hydrolase-like protein [Tistlia consotensis]SMF13321.1 phosphoglycolate phosphatase [Tistlia consotensis USBA 355]SNR50598.1 phosphoglycolate phosphatase [Tistlia consotensis]